MVDSTIDQGVEVDRRTLAALVDLGDRLAAEFGGPQDVEWAQVDGDLARAPEPAGHHRRPRRAVGPGLRPGAGGRDVPRAAAARSRSTCGCRRCATACARRCGSRARCASRTSRAASLVVTVDGRVAHRPGADRRDRRPPLVLVAHRAPGSAGSARRGGSAASASPCPSSPTTSGTASTTTSTRVPPLDELSARQLVALIGRGQDALRSLHAHEILLGLIADPSASSFTGASVALRLLAESRRDGLTDDEIVRRAPAVLALVPPKVGPLDRAARGVLGGRPPARDPGRGRRPGQPRGAAPAGPLDAGAARPGRLRDRRPPGRAGRARTHPGEVGRLRFDDLAAVVAWQATVDTAPRPSARPRPDRAPRRCGRARAAPGPVPAQRHGHGRRRLRRPTSPAAAPVPAAAWAAARSPTTPRTRPRARSWWSVRSRPSSVRCCPGSPASWPRPAACSRTSPSSPGSPGVATVVGHPGARQELEDGARRHRRRQHRAGHRGGGTMRKLSWFVGAPGHGGRGSVHRRVAGPLGVEPRPVLRPGVHRRRAAVVAGAVLAKLSTHRAPASRPSRPPAAPAAARTRTSSMRCATAATSTTGSPGCRSTRATWSPAPTCSSRWWSAAASCCRPAPGSSTSWRAARSTPAGRRSSARTSHAIAYRGGLLVDDMEARARSRPDQEDDRLTVVPPPAPVNAVRPLSVVCAVHRDRRRRLRAAPQHPVHPLAAAPGRRRIRVVVESRSNRAEPSQTLDELTEAHVWFCRLEIKSDVIGEIDVVRGDAGHGTPSPCSRRSIATDRQAVRGLPRGLGPRPPPAARDLDGARPGPTRRRIRMTIAHHPTATGGWAGPQGPPRRLAAAPRSADDPDAVLRPAADRLRLTVVAGHRPGRAGRLRRRQRAAPHRRAGGPVGRRPPHAGLTSTFNTVSHVGDNVVIFSLALVLARGPGRAAATSRSP